LLNAARYAFMSAYLKGEEAKFITSDHFNKMSKASSVQDVWGIIKDTDIGSYFDKVVINTFDDVDGHLWRYFDECLRHLEWLKLLPDDMRKILRAYTLKYDISNIKAALQSISIDKKIEMIPAGVIHNKGQLKELSTAKDVDSIIDLLIQCKLRNYVPVLEEYQIEAGVKSRLLTEARLDSMYYQDLKKAALETKDGSTLSQAIGIMIDTTNLQIILRAIIDGSGAEAAEFTISGGYTISGEVAKELLALKLGDVPGRLEKTPYLDVVQEVLTNYNRTKSISVVEEITSKHKFRLVKEILSLRLLSPLIIAWYLILKEIEIRSLRLILKAMFDNIPLEEIRTFVVLSS